VKLIAVLIALLLIVATSACLTTTKMGDIHVETDTTSSQTAQNATEPAINVTVSSLGEADTLTLNGVPTSPPSGYKFVEYATYFQNINATKMDMGNPYYFKLLDTRGKIYTFDPLTFSVKQTVKGKTLGGLSVKTNTRPGDTHSGIIFFKIPVTTEPKLLIYNDSTNRIAINL
jgi:hypothetical protein